MVQTQGPDDFFSLSCFSTQGVLVLVHPEKASEDSSKEPPARQLHVQKSPLVSVTFKSLTHKAQPEVLLHQLLQAGEQSALKHTGAVCLNMDRLHEKLEWER